MIHQARAPDTLAAAGVALAVCALATWVLAVAARRAGWSDRRRPEEVVRKPRTAPVPPVGGLALLVGLVAGAAVDGVGLPWLPVLAALALGTLDDVLGARWWLKAIAQLAVAGLAARAAATSGVAPPVAVFAVAWLAQNAVNTFDNADGAAAALGLVAFGPLAPAGAALLGFLPFNVARRRDAVPRAYLGDAGSHLLGVLIALHPASWVFLTLPLLDLARLVPVRLAAGTAPWVGDRRHLAHRLEAVGLGGLATAAVLAAIAAPPLVTRLLIEGPAATLAGALGTAVLFLAALRATPATDAAGAIPSSR